MSGASTREATVNIYDAKTGLSKLIARVEGGEQITISRNGRPVARLIPYRAQKPQRAPGVWRGRVTIRPDFDELSAAEQAEWFGE